MKKALVIAIDGHSSCGKSTMAKKLAETLGYTYIDTGAMYRAVTLYTIRNSEFGIRNSEWINKVDVRQEGKRTWLNGEDVSEAIRSMEVSREVSKIAALPYVRTALVKLQQRMGEKGGIVMDGRDIGTTVFPNADLKIFVTASAEVRAERRYKEMINKGLEANYEEILANVKERDYLDSHREVSPLVQAEDAILLDNSEMSIGEQDEWLRSLVEQKLKTNNN